METTAELTSQDTETWTLFTFTDPTERIPPFQVWKLTRGGVTVAGASPEQARNRLAAKMRDVR
jgi:hypothetical protein